MANLTTVTTATGNNAKAEAIALAKPPRSQPALHPLHPTLADPEVTGSSGHTVGYPIAG